MSSNQVGYPELAEELWCHRYYLRNLCDTARFPDWPLVDHVPFLQARVDAITNHDLLSARFPFCRRSSDA